MLLITIKVLVEACLVFAKVCDSLTFFQQRQKTLNAHVEGSDRRCVLGRVSL